MTSVIYGIASPLYRSGGFSSPNFETEFLDLSETDTTSSDLEVTLITCSMLTELRISRCQNLTDDAMIFVGQFAHLQRLDLSYSQWLTDCGLGHLVELTQLKCLKLTGCSKITFFRKEHANDLSRLFSQIRGNNEQ
jgi:hypothetical protein